MLNKTIKLNCEYIIYNNLIRKESKELFNINDNNLERIYLRHLIADYGIKRVKFILREK